MKEKKKTNLFAACHEFDDFHEFGTRKEFEVLTEKLDAKTKKGQTIGIEMTQGLLKSFNDFMKLDKFEIEELVNHMNSPQLFLYNLLKFCRNKGLKPVPLQSLSVLTKVMKQRAGYIFGGINALEVSTNNNTLKNANRAKRGEELLMWPVMDNFMSRRILRLKLDNALVGYNHVEPLLQKENIVLANPEMYKKYIKASMNDEQGLKRARYIRRLYSKWRRIKRQSRIKNIKKRK